MNIESLRHTVVADLSEAGRALVEGDTRTANTRLDRATHGAIILKSKGIMVHALVKRLHRLHSQWEAMQA